MNPRSPLNSPGAETDTELVSIFQRFLHYARRRHRARPKKREREREKQKKKENSEHWARKMGVNNGGRGSEGQIQSHTAWILCYTTLSLPFFSIHFIAPR